MPKCNTNLTKELQSLFRIGQLLLDLGPALECAWYTQWLSFREDRFSLCQQESVEIILLYRCRPPSHCWDPPPPRLAWTVQALGRLPSLWVYMCISPAVSWRLFPWSSPSPLALCLLFFKDPWALGGGVWWRHTIQEWVLPSLALSAQCPDVSLFVNSHRL